MRTCIFDMETMGFDADFDRMICSVVKEYGTRRDNIIIRPKHYNDDIDSILRVKETLERFDILVTYYGKGFDIPWLNSRLLLMGEPRVRKMYHIDLYYIIKNMVKRTVRRKSLGHIADIFELEEGKMRIPNKIWRGAHDGDESCIRTIVERCKSDVRLTEQTYDRLKDCGWICTLRKD